MTDTPGPCRVSPSRIARYYFHDCERFLRYSSTVSRDRAASGVPESEPDTGAVMEAIQEEGYSWEEEVVGRLLQGRVLVGPPGATASLRDTGFDVTGTLAVLREARPGQFVYQPTFRPPPQFYERVGMDPSVAVFSDSHPDLVEVTEVLGVRHFQIIDVKRSDTAKAVHHIQILLYALQLRDILLKHGIEGVADVRCGKVWLGQALAPTDLDLDGVRPHVLRFLREDVNRICGHAAARAEWHIQFRCEWCPYFGHCTAEARRTNNVSRLAGLNGYGKRFLSRQDVASLDDLAAWLATPDADATLARSASLAGRGHHLRGLVRSYAQGGPVRHGGSSMALPAAENVAVFLTAQEEPLEGTCYLAGAFVTVRLFAAQGRVAPMRTVRQAVTGSADPGRPEAWVAKARGDGARVAGRFINYLLVLFENVASYNQSVGFESQLSLQCYVHNAHEHAVISRLLLAALDDPESREGARQLLLFFSGPDLAYTEQQPGDPVAHPLVTLVSAQAMLVALPVDHSPTLPESLQALGSSFDYPRNPAVHFPLGHGLRPDGIHKVWNGAAEIAAVREEARSLLLAAHHLLDRIREHADLATFPPKFSLPRVGGIRTPLLARLAFFARYESVVACVETRAARAEPREVQRALGQIVEVEALGGDAFRILGSAIDLDVDDGMPNWILVADTPAGRVAQLRFPDYRYRASWEFGATSADRGIVAISEVGRDQAGIPTSLSVEWRQPLVPGAAAGGRYLLYGRFIDFFVDPTVAALERIDREGASGLVELLTSPRATPLELEARIDERITQSLPRLSLTPSQRTAFLALRRHSEVVVWGPPGTGKTHFIGATVAAMAAAHEAEGRPFRVLVTAFTHAAIEHVCRSIARSLQTAYPDSSVPVWKVDWTGETLPKAITDRASKALAGDVARTPLLVLGATMYRCAKAGLGPLFDLVVIDEASQVKLPDACIAMTLRASQGRLLLAGDHKQLPPIVHVNWPSPPAPEPSGPRPLVIQGSVLDALRVEGDPALGVQLLENFRMNAALTRFPGQFIYGERYQCANPEVAGQALCWTAGPDNSPFVAHCLDPQFPLVVVVVEGIEAGKENLHEAALVADLASALRDGMRAPNGSPYADDHAFFYGTARHGPGLFIVSPHHVQIAAIHGALGDRGLLAPFVNTVEKMQGQEAEAVIISYGVSDPEFAMREAAFIYGLNRLNVAITRARCKAILFLPRPLLDAPPAVLDVEEAVSGLGFMRELLDKAATEGERTRFVVDGVELEVARYG